MFEPPVLPLSISTSRSYTPVLHAPSSIEKHSDAIIDVLDDDFVASHCSGYYRFLVR